MEDTSKSLHLPAGVYGYLLDHSTPPDGVQRELIEETRALGDVSIMQIAPEQGAFLTLLTRAVGARRAVEVGTFTGYSALCLAQGIGSGGHLLCCDISEEWTAIARRYWERAGVADRVELRLGPAAETLASLPRREQFDVAFIDADKPGYIRYYEELLPRVRRRGLVLADNVLSSGRVADPGADDQSTEAIRAFNDHVAADDRVECAILPVADGLSLIRKR